MNYLNRITIVLLFLSFGISNALSAQIFINEIMAKNDNVITDENGDFDDWIELYNAGTTPVDIAGYYFSEEASDPTFWEIPDTDPAATTIPAGGYLIIWADEDIEDGPHHIDFKLSADGQDIFMYAPDGATLIDALTYPSLSSDTSYGRETDGAADFQTFTAPSPGANNTAGISSYNAIIVSRINDGSDDAEEPVGQNYLTLNDPGINMVNDWSGDQTVGFRFDELNIPPGAVVSRAYIQFTNASTSNSSGPCNLNINGHATGNSATFVSEAQNISSRALTTATVNWQPADWETSGETGVRERTPDLSEIVQEILDQPDWSENSALTFVITGTGIRMAYAYENGDPQRVPQLYLEIALPVVNVPVTNLFINEIAPGGTSYTDETGSFEDWVEIYNGGTETVNLGGLFLSDNYNNMTKWQISQPYFLEAGDFVVLFTDNDPEEGGLHADFSLEASGEELVLSQALNNSISVIDSVSFPAVPFQTSYGRATDGADNFIFFGEVTPNESNNGALLGLAKPTIDLANGIYQGTQMVGLSHPDPTVTLRYTLDGKEPTSSSTAYSNPFAINDNTSVKAAAFKSGHVKSTSAVGSYLFNIESNIPTLYINSDPDNFFDDEIGIYVKGTNGVPGFCRTDSVNWNQVDWERPINLGMFLPDGSEAFNVNAGIRISGGCSRIYGQKSFNIYTRRNMYGDDAIDYPIYEGRGEDVVYERIKLRNSGQDYLRTMFRDGLVQTLLWDKIDMDLLGYQPTTLYLNGEFWGIYNIRELFNDEHFENVYGVDNDEIDLLKNPGMPWEEVKRGTDAEYKALFDFASNNDLSVPANYQTVADQFDINQLINYWAYSIYIAKFDWPANNVILWKEKKSGEKWRYGALDHDGSTDNGFAFETTPDFNTLEQVMVANSTEWPNHSNSTLFLRKLLDNENFRNEFVQRSCSFMELIYSEERTANITDSLQALIEPHIPDQEIRWGEELSIGGNEQNWRGWVANMKDFFVTRPDFHRGFMNDQFNLDGTYQLTLNYNEATNGRVVINSNEMETPYNFTNLYFKNIPVQLKAIAEEGYRFSHWLETGETTEVVNFVAGEDAVMTPIFDELVAVDEPETLVSYQLFPNPTTGKVNLLASFDQVTEASIAIYDLLGKVIYTRKINGLSINEQLDLSAHTAGIYLVNITTEKGTITERLVLQQ